MIKIPQSSNFKLEIAKQLLLLVEKAHKEFDEAQKNEQWDWYKDDQNSTMPTPIGSAFWICCSKE